MKFNSFALSALALGMLPLSAAVPELEKLVPDAKGYELIYQFSPIAGVRSAGYKQDNSDALSGTLKRIGYLLKLTDKQGKETWVYAEMDPFTQDLYKVGVPNASSGVIQTYVNNLKVASNVPGVATGTFEKGNIEFWQGNYGGGNGQKIPGASGKYDFGDAPDRTNNTGYGSMQVHNYLKKQTVFAFNSHGTPNCDLGIGNNPNPKGHPDWTFQPTGNKYKSAEMYVVGKFDNLKKLNPVKVDNSKIKLSAKLDRANPDYKPGETMKFTFVVDFGGQKLPDKPYTLFWKRTGDDGITKSGTVNVVPNQPIEVTTSSAKPGFVRMEAWLRDHKGNNVGLVYPHPWQKGKTLTRTKAFDGGAGVQITTLKQAVPEPKDFDAFWAKQKAKLDKVPLKYTMTEVQPSNAKVKQYAVSIDCAGPRPVTGYLSIPVNAKPKSLKAVVNYQGYGTGVQKPAGWLPGDKINFTINAHGYDLGKDAAYYKDFFAKIKSNNQIYAFDPKQNADPEQAYFNGMALRVMRSLQFVKSLPQWDGKNLQANGGSQGGLQTVWAAALDPQVNLATPSIPWCADFGATTIKRLNGWRPSYVPGLNYYDIVNHAKRIPKTCQVNITKAGLGDYTCPPSGVTVLYNNIPGPKKIKYIQGADHGFNPPGAQVFEMESK